jgi:MFS family permease
MRLYWAAIVGNILEHYDQALYGFLIPFLAPIFFPHSDPIYSLLAGYALLPLGLISKPLGAYFFGRIGDRYGLRLSLSITLLGMAFATGAMGFLPTFEQVGWIAPALLSLGRLLQNFFAAGETTGGALFLLEKADKRKRGLMSSFFDASGIAGILLAAVAAMTMGEAQWRWLFWLGCLSGIAGLIVRRSIPEVSPGIKTNWRWRPADWVPIFGIATVSGFSYANYYLVSNFLNGFLPLVSSITIQEALALNTLLLIVDFLALPFFGWLSLYIEKEWLMMGALITGISLAIPLFLLLEGADLWVAGIVRITFTIIGVCLAAPYHAWAMELAPKERCFSVCAVGSAIGSRLIGAPIPAISLWLYHKSGWVASPAIPLIGTAFLAMGAMAYLSRRTRLDRAKCSF